MRKLALVLLMLSGCSDDSDNPARICDEDFAVVGCIGSNGCNCIVRHEDCNGNELSPPTPCTGQWTASLCDGVTEICP
jgi:hypothetical protein